MKRVQRIVVGVSLLFICGLLISAVVPNVPSGTWQATGDMAAPRTGATATLFPDGRLMIVGGTDANGEPLATAEFYNADGSVSSAPSMSIARSGHAAIFLYDGRLLVTGGRVPGGGITNSAEVFDPLTNHWQTLSTTLLDARAGHTVSQLPD
jgi:N-acetylneuraminic acid mutarotase